MDKADKLDLKQSTRRPFKSRDLAFSREVNRQVQSNNNNNNIIIISLFKEDYILSKHTYLTYGPL